MDENKSLEPTPDQLLQILDSQLARQRSERANGRHRRTAFRVGALVLILGGCAAALLILQLIVQDMPRKERPAATESTAAHDTSRNY